HADLRAEVAARSSPSSSVTASPGRVAVRGEPRSGGEPGDEMIERSGGVGGPCRGPPKSIKIWGGMSRPPMRSEGLELRGLSFHPNAERGHEHEIGMSAAGEQRVAITPHEIARLVLVEPHLRGGRRGIREIAGQERGIRLQREET